MGLRNRKFRYFRGLFVFFCILLNSESIWAISCNKLISKSEPQELIGTPIKEIFPFLSWKDVIDLESFFLRYNPGGGILTEEYERSIKPLKRPIIEQHRHIPLHDRYELGVSNSLISDFHHLPRDFLISIEVTDILAGAVVIYFEIDENYIIRKARVVDPGLASIAMKHLNKIFPDSSTFDFVKDSLGIADEVDPNLVLKYTSRVVLVEDLVKDLVVEVVPLNLDLELIEDSEDAIFVDQRQYAILRYEENSPFKALKAVGASESIIIALYHRSTRTGILMHIDRHVDRLAHKFNNYFKNFIQEKLSNEFDLNFINHEWEINVVLGSPISKDFIFEITDLLYERNLVFVAQGIMVDRQNLWLNVEHGSLFSFTFNPKLASYQSMLPLPPLMLETQIFSPARGSE